MTYTGKGNANTYWTNTGKHFGFPDCCIQAFLDDNLPEVTPFDGTGYKPCKSCIKLDQKVLVDYINTKRIHPDPFPNSDTFVEVYRESMYG
mgnify:CR=1 FL=1|tara:strand:- start:450 stop:722 length:273 start_codon:yes stop_codon:yes gene_type:complete